MSAHLAPLSRHGSQSCTRRVHRPGGGRVWLIIALVAAVLGGIGWYWGTHSEYHYAVVRAGELCKSLHDIRERGYSVDDEEAQVGLRCVSAVVYDDRSEPLAAISVSGKASRVPDDRLPILGQFVRQVADELTTALGGVVPAETK